MSFKKYIIGISAGLALLCTTSANATTLNKLSFNEVVNQSAACVVGKVQSVESVTRNGQVMTLTTFSVSSTAFGNVGQTVTVETAGGRSTMGRLLVNEVVAGTPRFFNNQENLLFLSAPNAAGEYSVVGFNQGRFSVNPAGAGLVTLPINNEAELMSVDNAFSVIRAARAGSSDLTITP